MGWNELEMVIYKWRAMSNSNTMFESSGMGLFTIKIGTISRIIVAIVFGH